MVGTDRRPHYSFLFHGVSSIRLLADEENICRYKLIRQLPFAVMLR